MNRHIACMSLGKPKKEKRQKKKRGNYSKTCKL